MLINCGNGSSFIIQNIFTDLSDTFDEGLLKIEDKWILSKYSTLIKDTHAAIDNFNFSAIFSGLYRFFWDDFCAYYIEICKPYLYGKLGSTEEINNKKWLLFTILTGTIKLLHPVAPFITEELFSILKEKSNSLTFPEGSLFFQLEETF